MLIGFLSRNICEEFRQICWNNYLNRKIRTVKLRHLFNEKLYYIFEKKFFKLRLFWGFFCLQQVVMLHSRKLGSPKFLTSDWEKCNETPFEVRVPTCEVQDKSINLDFTEMQWSDVTVRGVKFRPSQFFGMQHYLVWSLGHSHKTDLFIFLYVQDYFPASLV